MWKILEPIQIGKKICKNRILMAAHSYGYIDNNGLPTYRLTDYLAERAKGGIGLVIMGGTSVSSEGTLVERVARNIDDAIIPRYHEIAQNIHKYGTLVFDQLMHVGGQLDAFPNSRIVGPSPIPHECTKGIPLELSEREIYKIINEFAAAAKRADLAGLDGIEIKCDQGFLIYQFLSPYYNRRTDDFGGSYDRRLRFLLEIIEKIRQVVGSNMIVGVRITGDSLTPGDLTRQDGVQIASDIEKTGGIDYIHVNAATNSTYKGYMINHGDSSIESMNFASIANEIKKNVSLPVIVASMVTHISEAEHLVSSGIADLVAMTRAHIADPEIVKKIGENRLEDIRPCVLCNQECVGNHWKGLDVHCIHNVSAGREREFGSQSLIKSPKCKSVAVIGGGVAGMEVARIATLRGHKVQLFEKQKNLGGQVLYASKLPYKQGLYDIVLYLEKQIRKLSIDIYCGVEITKDDLSSLKEDFEIIVCATGAKLYIPPIYNTNDQCSIFTIQQMLEQSSNIGQNVLVVDIDWRQDPLGVAEWLVQRGRSVTIISSTFYIGEGLDIVTRSSHYSRIEGLVTLKPLTSLVSYEQKTATLKNVLSNRFEELKPIDSIVFAAGALPEVGLYSLLINESNNVFRVGDCSNPRGISEAMLDANSVARSF